MNTVTERFEQYPYHLRYQPHTQEAQSRLTIGMTTRMHGLSPYPENALNMARYIDDAPERVTEHQQRLADTLHIPRAHWVFPIQTHENHIAQVTRADRMTNIETLTDALHGIDGRMIMMSC